MQKIVALLILIVHVSCGFTNFEPNYQAHLSSLSVSTSPDSIMETRYVSSASTPVLFPESSKFHVQNNGLRQRRRWLVVDFDGTCTQHDTTPLLPRLASFAARNRSSLSLTTNTATCHESSSDRSEHEVEQLGYDTQSDLQRRLSMFEQLEGEFLRRYSDAKNALLPNTSELLGNKKSLHSIYDTLDALDEPSNIVTQMVSDSGVLHGLGHADSSELEEMLNLKGVSTVHVNEEEKHFDKDVSTKVKPEERIEVYLRPGCETTLARTLLSHSLPSQPKEDSKSCLGWSLAVLSINWCPALINACLVQPVLRKKRSLLKQQCCQTEVPIWSNSVSGEGVVTLHVPGALAKRDRIVELRNCLEHLDNSSGDADVCQKHLIVYVGDSSTDLAALLEADIGIIMGKSNSTFAIAERWDIDIIPLKMYDFDAERNRVSDQKNRSRLWQADSWGEINTMLEELDVGWE